MQIRVLGPVRLVGDSPVDLGPPRHRALFAALAVDADHVVPAEVLLEKVWGLDQTTALGTLHSAVSHLRRSLRDHPAPSVQTQAPGYLLRTHGTELDAAVFVRLLARARSEVGGNDPGSARRTVQTALELWRGEPYADVDADFARAEADRLSALRLAAVELAAELDLALGRHAELAAALPTTVSDHPLREGLRASLILALYRAGRQAEALRTYDEGRALLADELGVDPGPALKRLHARVLAQDPALDPPEPRPARVPLDHASPSEDPSEEASTRTRPTDGPGPLLVGRDPERSRLQAVLAPGTRVRSAVLVGEAGVGKTALVEDVLAGLPDDVEVEWGRCWDHDSTAAFWPWSQALGALARTRGTEETTRLLDESGPEAGVLVGRPVPGSDTEAAAGRHRLFAAVAHLLVAAARTRPLVLVLEDLQWADQDSADLLSFVLETCRDAPLRLLLTVRSPADTTADRGPALLAELARRTAVTRVDLAGLGVGAVAELATARLGRAVRPEQAVALHERTNGNPFFITELVRLRQDETDETGHARGTVPDNVRTVVERRLAHLPPETAELLATAAVVGRDFPLSLLARVVDRRPAEIAEALDVASASGVLAPSPDLEHQRFGHALVQESLLAGLGPMRRAGLHASVAAVLEEELTDPRRQAALVASHWAAAGPLGDVDRAVHAALRAAEVDQAAYASNEAERQLRRALDLARLAPGARADALELEVRTRLATLLTLVRGYNDEGVAVERRRSLELAERLGSAVHLLPALWGRWGIALVSGQFEDAHAHADAMEEAGTRAEDAMLLAAARLARGQTFWHQGRFGSAREELRRAVAEFAAHADEVRLEVFLQHPEPTASAWLALVLEQLGERDGADAAARRAEGHVAVAEHPFTAIYRRVLEGFRRMVRAEPEAAFACAEVGLDEAVRLGFDQLAVFSLLPLGWGRGAAGDDDGRGLAELRSALAALGSVAARPAFATLIWWLVADLHHRAGDDAAALSALREADAAQDATGERAVLAERLVLESRVLRRLGRAGDVRLCDDRLREHRVEQRG